jgi:hypothetical protein
LSENAKAVAYKKAVYRNKYSILLFEKSVQLNLFLRILFTK